MPPKTLGGDLPYSHISRVLIHVYLFVPLLAKLLLLLHHGLVTANLRIDLVPMLRFQSGPFLASIEGMKPPLVP